MLVGCLREGSALFSLELKKLRLSIFCFLCGLRPQSLAPPHKAPACFFSLWGKTPRLFKCFRERWKKRRPRGIFRSFGNWVERRCAEEMVFFHPFTPFSLVEKIENFNAAILPPFLCGLRPRNSSSPTHKTPLLVMGVNKTRRERLEGERAPGNTYPGIWNERVERHCAEQMCFFHPFPFSL